MITRDFMLRSAQLDNQQKNKNKYQKNPDFQIRQKYRLNKDTNRLEKVSEK